MSPNTSATIPTATPWFNGVEANTADAPLVFEFEPGVVDPEPELEPVPLSCLARAWNAAKLWEPESTELTAKTIP